MNTNSFYWTYWTKQIYLGHGKFLGWKNENAPVKVALPKPTFCNRSIT